MQNKILATLANTNRPLNNKGTLVSNNNDPNNFRKHRNPEVEYIFQRNNGMRRGPAIAPVKYGQLDYEQKKIEMQRLEMEKNKRTWLDEYNEKAMQEKKVESQPKPAPEPEKEKSKKKSKKKDESSDDDSEDDKPRRKGKGNRKSRNYDDDYDDDDYDDRHRRRRGNYMICQLNSDKLTFGFMS